MRMSAAREYVCLLRAVTMPLYAGSYCINYNMQEQDAVSISNVLSIQQNRAAAGWHCINACMMLSAAWLCRPGFSYTATHRR
jgi:hypothetical protein